MAITFYAPRFIDESMTFPDKKGRSSPTGVRSGFVIGRRFYKTGRGKFKAERMLLPFSWADDTQEAKAEALAKVIEGMEELPELDENPPLTWVPKVVKARLTDAVTAQSTAQERK